MRRGHQHPILVTVASSALALSALLPILAALRKGRPLSNWDIIIAVVACLPFLACVALWLLELVQARKTDDWPPLNHHTEDDPGDNNQQQNENCRRARHR
jgi:hypothetical protein